MIQTLDSDFHKLLYNFRGVSGGEDPFETYPELFKYSEFKQSFMPLRQIFVLRYITYVYDENSPFRKEVGDLFERKRQAAIEAGFEVDDKEKFSPEVEEMIFGKNTKVNKMVVRYIQLHYNRKFSYLIYLEDSFEKLLRDSLGGKENVHNMKAVQKELDEMYEEMLANDDSVDLRTRLYKFVTKERLGISPEEIAEKIQNGVEPISQDDF